MMLEDLPARCNADSWLIHRGRFVTLSMLVAVGPDEFMVDIDRGTVRSVRRGPFVMPSYAFGVRADRDSWEEFWRPVPKPGFHDLFALLKRGLVTLEGDLHPFMSNLLYFKDVFASLRAKDGSR